MSDLLCISIHEILLLPQQAGLKKTLHIWRTLNPHVRHTRDLYKAQKYHNVLGLAVAEFISFTRTGHILDLCSTQG